MQRPAFTCPRCGTPSWSLADGLAGYCGLCRAVTGWVPARFTCPSCARSCLPPERGYQGAVACVTGHPPVIMTPSYAQPDEVWECGPCSARLAVTPGHQGAVLCACGLPMAPVPPPRAPSPEDVLGEFARMAAYGPLEPLEMGRRWAADLMDELSAYGRRTGPLQVTVNQFPPNPPADLRALIVQAGPEDGEEPWDVLGYPLDDSARWTPGSSES